MNIKAYQIGPLGKQFKITPQNQSRECFQGSKTIQNAYRCLPLRIGSELGWQINCPVNFCCNWNGKDHSNGLKIFFEDENESRISSHFGAGILTFRPGYIIRSPRKKSLYIRGPTNFYKEYCQYLDAVIETDWLNFPFSYSIKINKKNTDIFFKKDEPICSFYFIDLEKIANQNIQVERVENKPLLLDSFRALAKDRGLRYEKYEKDLLEHARSYGYYEGGFTSKDQKDFAWGCPYLHFKRLNLKSNNTFKLKDILNYFKIKASLSFKTWYNIILNYYYNNFFLKSKLPRFKEKVDSEFNNFHKKSSE